MFKTLFVMLTIVVLVLIGLDSDFFMEENKKIEKKSVVKVEEKEIQEDKKESIVENRDTSKERKKIEKPKETPLVETSDNTYQELIDIIEKAQNSYSKNELKKALSYYDNIIERSKDSKDTEILKLFAKATFYKISIYGGIDLYQKMNEIISLYDTVIDKFKNSQEVELLELYAKAQFVKAKLTERDKSLSIYDEVIDKFKQSSNKKLFKIYTSAQYNKAYISSRDDALEIFNQLITNFKKDDTPEMLRELYKAQQNKIYLLEQDKNQKDETIETYDDVIKVFSSRKEEEFQAFADEASFRKSFLLMGENDEASMEIYDDIIKKFESNNPNHSEVPLQVAYSIINNIELSLITNNDDSRYRELAETYLMSKENTKTQLDMLEILKNAQVSNQDEALEAWKKENKEYQFTNWSFSELQKWNSQMEEGEQKRRIEKYINEFSKYNNSYQEVYEESPK